MKLVQPYTVCQSEVISLTTREITGSIGWRCKAELVVHGEVLQHVSTPSLNREATEEKRVFPIASRWCLHFCNTQEEGEQKNVAGWLVWWGAGPGRGRSRTRPPGWHGLMKSEELLRCSDRIGCTGGVPYRSGSYTRVYSQVGAIS